MKRVGLILGLTAGALWAGPPTAVAETSSLDPSALRQLPVLENGRKMPMDSYARLKLLQFSGRSRFDRQPALNWLCKVLFAPTTTRDDAVFLINNPEVAQAMGITTHQRARYPFSQLEPALATLSQLAASASALEEKQRTPVDREILRLFAGVNDYLQLHYAFLFTVPHDDFTAATPATRAALGLPAEGSPLGFLDVYQQMQGAQEKLRHIESKPEAEWTEEQSGVFQLSSTVFQWAQHYRRLPPAMLPLHAHGDEIWMGPWDAMTFFHRDPVLRAEILLLRDLATSYRQGRQVEFDLAARRLQQSILGRAQPDREIRNLGLELKLNQFDPFYRAELLYGLAFLFGFASLLAPRRWLRVLAAALAVCALVPHTWGVVARMIIMGRPPMTNLYATFIFVSWVMVVLGLVLEYLQRNGVGVSASAFAGLALLMTSGRFAAEGDHLGKVVAVLDSNFWLSTHVVCITMGYAGCVAAGVVGHIYILQTLFAPGREQLRASTYRAVLGLLGFGLTFSFFGTMLGGVWADQSWGRFWGWDPKENGALLIVLWCAILFHARLGKMVDELGVATGSVLGVIVVMFAWLGVNLLGVGLHSYGFTTGLARGLLLYILAELAFLGTALTLIQRRVRAAAPVL